MNTAVSLSFCDDPTRLAPPRVIREDRADGTFVLRSPDVLRPYSRRLGDWLEHWARTTPETLFLAERTAEGGWRKVTYGEARRIIGRIGQSLLNLKPKPGQPVVAISDNSVDVALVKLAAMHVGIPSCVTSSAYARNGSDHSRIAGMLNQVQPLLVFGASPAEQGAAIRAWGGSSTFAFSRDAEMLEGALSFDDLASVPETLDVARAFDRVQADDAAKYLFTSGSTGTPKVVINTHRMLCSNQQAMGQVWRFLDHVRPVLLDWLPWSHTFGTNHNFNMVLRNGGTLYIDEGRPVPGLIEKTIANLLEVQPTLYFNVPRGYEALATALENDPRLAARFFDGVVGLFNAGATLPVPTWERLQRLAQQYRSEAIWITAGWGATETSPVVTNVHFRTDRPNCLGLPIPGCELKFVPTVGKLELRVRGPNVFPGYYGAPDLTANAFDDEGFYRIGDAGKLIDETRPECGVAFDGRIAEDFKLSSGTWVSAGVLRLRAVATLGALAQDVVVTGHDRDEVGLMIFPGPLTKSLEAHEVSVRIREALIEMRQQDARSAQNPGRALLLAESPSVDAGEINDKGYINQSAVLKRRADLVTHLYAGGEGVITTTVETKA